LVDEKYGELGTNRPLLTGFTPSSMTWAYWARLMAWAAARRMFGSLNGLARQLS